MTPELIQAIQILQFNTQELDSYVEEQLLTNPVLEYDEQAESKQEDDDAKLEKEKDPLSEFIRERGYDDISYNQQDYNKEEKEDTFERFVSADITLPEHLMFQLQFASSGKTCRRIGRYIIESLDENGYMTSTPEEIAGALKTDIKNVKKVTELIQTFDPAGVGADSLGKCLLIQLEQRGMSTEAYKKLLTEHIEDLAANRLNVIAKSLGIPATEVQEMGDFIRTLEPRPGREFSDNVKTRYIVPDVIVRAEGDEYTIEINENSIPRLRVSAYYEKVLRESEGDEKVRDYLSERLNSAMWLIKSIEQRKQTVLNVVESILKFQREFFDEGDKHLKILTLKQVAEDVGIHESTVSRSVNGKYMECPRGVFELRYFFSGGVEDTSGEGIASTSIKTHIRELVAGENEKAPLSDQKIVNILMSRGFNISRRTVAKYRDEMGILSSSKRKRYD